MAVAGVPADIAARFASSRVGSDVSSVGDLGARILASVPEQFRPAVEPYVPNIVTGFHDAFSIAIASALWIGVAAAVIATLVTVLGLPELPLRAHHGPVPKDAARSEPTPMAALE
jgi:hypothetical protein